MEDAELEELDRSPPSLILFTFLEALCDQSTAFGMLFKIQ
jgi:hypothetical protein